MNVHQKLLRGRLFRWWDCCGKRWELFITTWRKGDQDWAPICSCGKTIPQGIRDLFAAAWKPETDRTMFYIDSSQYRGATKGIDIVSKQMSLL